ncbi:MAG: tetratricopeptide repeat protein [Opitutae bacterium]|nr:tetratricopeptide repeat protein [Opitutae bacterium]
MPRWFAFWLVFALLAGGSRAADANRVSALEQQLQSAPPEARSGILVQLSTEIEADDMQRALNYAQQARELAREKPDQIRADTRLAAVERRRGRYKEALALATDAANRARDLHDDTLRADALLIVGWTQGSLANFPAALDTYRELLPLADQRADEVFLARVYTAIGIAYADSGDSARSLEAYQTALTHAQRGTDRRIVASVLNNLGNLATEARNFAAAHRYHEEALALRLANGADTRGIADSRQNLAELAVAEGKPAAAIPFIEEAIAAHAKLNLRRNLANARLTYAAALRALDRPKDALVQLQSAQQLAESLNTPTIRERVYRALADHHEAQGDYRAALDWQRKTEAAHDQALGERSRQRLDALQALYDAERRQLEIETLRRAQTEKDAALATARWQRTALLALIGIGIIAAFALLSRHRIQRRAEERILAETRTAKETAERADSLKTRLVAMVSHDIRGPLHNILHFAEEARREPDPRATAPHLDFIVSETQRVASLAQDLLDVTALESGALSIDRRPADLTEIVRATLGQLEPTARAKGQTLVFAPPGRDDGVLHADAGRLGQVVANLVSNAIKYSPRDSTISLALERTAHAIRLFVRDRGPGIPEAERAALFQPFSRLSARPTGGESSHGLGLSLARDLVRLHGGTIDVHCPPEGGSVFTVELPVAAT